MIKTKKNQSGGKFISKGSYGCVITPELPCHEYKHQYHKNHDNTRKNTKSIISKNNKNKTKKPLMVSKIISHYDDDIYYEYEIMKTIKNLDKDNKYFITYNDICKIKDKNIVKNRNNIATGRFIYNTTINNSKNNSTKFIFNNSRYKAKKNKKQKICKIEINEKPINIIMDYGGVELGDIIEDKRKLSGKKSELREFFFDENNSKNIIKHLVQGLKLLHDNKIVHRDIKLDNILLNIKPKETESDNNGEKKNITFKDLNVRYIDYTLTKELDNQYISSIYNIIAEGTYYYMSPEIFTSKNIRKYYKDENAKNIYLKNNKYINKYIISIYKDFKINEELDNIKDKNIELFQTLYNNYRDRKTFLHNYFNKPNGYIYKMDIYALGITLFSLFDNYYGTGKIKDANSKLYDLLLNMIRFNPDKRFNINQCLEHKYFH